MPARIGSVGKNMSKLKPGIRRLSSTDKGEKNTTAKISLSDEKITRRATASKTGSAAAARVSLVTTSQMFNKMKLIEIR